MNRLASALLRTETPKNQALLYGLALLLALAVSAVSWPGFLTFDGVQALEQARNGITNPGYPPMVSYVWALTDKVVPGQGGMLLLQNLLVFLGVAKFGLAAGAPRWLLAATLLLIAAAPATLGPMLVVWKDVAFGGLLALGAGFAVGYWHRGRRRDLLLALLILLIGAAYRLNSIPALTPLFLLLAWRLLPAISNLVKRSVAVVGLAVLLSILAFAWVLALSTWRLPDFQRMQTPNGYHGWVAASNLLGISVCSGDPVLPSAFYPQGSGPEILPGIYHPEHVQMSFYGPQDRPNLRDAAFLEIDEDALRAIWLDALANHPLCYLQHRLNIATYLLGLNPGPVYYVTDPNVFPNDMGLTVEYTLLTTVGTQWLSIFVDTPLARTWVFIVIALAALLWRWRRPDPVAVTTFGSGLAYLGVSILLLPAADLRYQFWVILAMLMTVLATAGTKTTGTSVAPPA